MKKMMTALLMTMMMILTGCNASSNSNAALTSALTIVPASTTTPAPTFAPTPALKAAFREAGFSGSESYIEYGDDWSYVIIDTNPNDIDDYYDIVALKSVFTFNKLLGFPDSVAARMKQTTWSQGIQSYENERFSVSWTYHPNKGLVATYEETK